MKHKAQESLKSKCNECEEMARITHRGGCAFRNIDNTRCKEYDTLQDLINCQLTPNEINECLLTLGLYEDSLNIQGNLTLSMKKFFKGIKRKLRKQKEMWVSDDETN